MDEKENQSSCSSGMDRSYEEEERIITKKRKTKRTPKRSNTRRNEEFSTSHNQMPFDFLLNRGSLDLIQIGRKFVPHILIVNVGEDIIAKIIAVCERCAQDVYIMSANGFVSHVDFSCGGRATIYEGYYEIVSFTGYLYQNKMHGGHIADNLVIYVAGPDSSVSGGIVSNSLIAASPIQIVLCTFTHSPQTMTSVSDSSDSETSSAESSTEKMMAP